MDVGYREGQHYHAQIKCFTFHRDWGETFFFHFSLMCLYLLTNKVLVIYIMLYLCDLKFLLVCGFGNLKSSFVLFLFFSKV